MRRPEGRSRHRRGGGAHVVAAMDIWRTRATVRQRMVAAVMAAMVMVTVGGNITNASRHTMGQAVKVIVTSTGSSVRELERDIWRFGGKVTRDLSIINGVAAEVPAGSVDELRQSPGVRSVQPGDTRVRLQGQMGEGSGDASAVYSDVTRASAVWA